MLFAAFRSEIDTDALFAWALQAGKTSCLPRILGPRLMEPSASRDPDADLEPGSWGIPEPRTELAECRPERSTRVVVPGSVFDGAGRRCGYGGGFYDTFLPRTRPDIPGSRWPSRRRSWTSCRARLTTWP